MPRERAERVRGHGAIRNARLSCTLFVFGLVSPFGIAYAQANEECLECHQWKPGEEELAPSLLLRLSVFESSVHRDQDCIACHFELDGVDEYPHETNLPRVECRDCHDDDHGPISVYVESVHGQLAESGDERAPRCQDCHGDHDILPFHDADRALSFGRINTLCTKCHVEVASASPGELHADALVDRTCLACHDAHGPTVAEPRAADRLCMVCHEEDEPTDDLLSSTAQQHANSVHGQAGLTCVLCHSDLLEAEDFPHEEELAPVLCQSCHPTAGAAYERGLHSGTAGNGHTAAECTDCHGTHDIRPRDDPRSPVFPRNLPSTCEACHQPTPPEAHPAPAGEQVLVYEDSVHGKLLLEEGLLVSASCTSCHGSHEILATGDSEAATSRAHVPYTCGSCHAGMLERYLEGAHGSPFLSGEADVPVCTDCHNEHSIEDPALATSSVSSSAIAATCARCHADDELTASHELNATALSSWGDSYHGIAAAFGNQEAANCASCHGFHDILPSSDPRSRVHPANLDETCGSCHSWTASAFTNIPVHSVVDRESNFIPWLVRVVYAVLLIGVIGAFILFILIDLFGRLRLRLGWGPPETEFVRAEDWPDEDELIAPDANLPRMNRHARLQHGVLIVSFLLLVLTGIPVFLHDIDWLHSIIGIEGGYRLRSSLHRVGALGLIGLSAWHLGVLLCMPSARRWFASIMLRPRDVIDFAREMMFDLGIADWLSRRRLLRPFFDRHPSLAFRERPRLGRYGLVEKLEYGAVLWGNLIMILSGLILWRPDWFLAWLPTWTFDVCRIVHGFEATLAFLAIIIWHMYHVHLRPGIFPMSRTWLTGTIGREELRHHHPDEYLRILEARRARVRKPEKAGAR